MPLLLALTVDQAVQPVPGVGVAPERFHGIASGYGRIRLWLPLAAQRAQAGAHLRIGALAIAIEQFHARRIERDAQRRGPAAQRPVDHVPTDGLHARCAVRWVLRHCHGHERPL